MAFPTPPHPLPPSPSCTASAHAHRALVACAHGASTGPSLVRQVRCIARTERRPLPWHDGAAVFRTQCIWHVDVVVSLCRIVEKYTLIA
uniref:Uncharacterized protein n=1 Tax=Oryza rufipogon TaxID=4529 RepID=A0A0E0NRW9_ORYRU